MFRSKILAVLFGLLVICGPVAQFDSGCIAAEPDSDAVMAGYLLAPNERVPLEFDAGFSMYVSAWPLLENYPGRRFQTGLFGTWMFPTQEGNDRGREVNGKRFYTDVEGGLGWWRDTRFATATPKFIMGGVALNFREWANGPGAGKGRDWDSPRGKYGVVQLSSCLLWPPDGLNLKQGTRGEWFGYGYLPLPLTDVKDTTAGKSVKTGNQCWTLFLSSENFKGPVAFFTPFFWSQVTTEQPELEGKFLDTRPSNPNRALQMETQYIPAHIAEAKDGTKYAKVAHVLFPSTGDSESQTVQQIMSYKRSALWDSVEAWFNGGDVADGEIETQSSVVHQFTGRGSATWRIYETSTAKEDRRNVDWKSFATPHSSESDSFGYQWGEEFVAEQSSSEPESLLQLPTYFRLGDGSTGKPQWSPVGEDEVPDETGLRAFEFPLYERSQIDPYTTPDDDDSCWKSPGPVAGPFKAYPGDGSELTYYWYRFADQPAMLNADLNDEERERVQQRVEKLHRAWSRDRDYLPPPRQGNLADIDDALIVTPPAGLEIGYVPIVTRQGLVD